ncbi:MAG: phosphoribosylanthranilate isomerase [Thermoplasmatota archaeon]
MKVKICGIRNGEEAEIAANYADGLGFVVEYPEDVPWNLYRNTASKLIKKTPSSIYTVVITTGIVEKIIDILKSTRPNAVQLHGEETIDEVKNLIDYCEEKGIDTIKALPIDVETGKSYGKDPIEVAELFLEIGVDSILFDSKTTGNAGGTGKTIDWAVLKNIRKEIDIPIILAGGLNSTNLKKAYNVVKPDIVDVLSGVETNGRKDESKMEQFYKIAKRC